MLMRLSESLLKRFLLGGLAEEKRSEIEDLALRDGEAFDLIEAMEADLVDRYVRGELTATDRRAFERRLAPLPRIQRQIAYARILAVAADQRVESPDSGLLPARHPWAGRGPTWRPAWRPLLTIAATALVAMIGTFLAYQAGLGPWPEWPGDSAPATGAPGVTYALAPGALRDATAGQLVDRADHTWIGLSLDLDHPAVRAASSDNVEVVLESVARGEVIQRRQVTTDELASGALTWVLRSGDLAPGQYTILLLEHTTEPMALANYEITVR